MDARQEYLPLWWLGSSAFCAISAVVTAFLGYDGSPLLIMAFIAAAAAGIIARINKMDE